MKKKELYLSLFWMALGIICMLIAMSGITRATSTFWGFTGAWLGCGTMGLCHYFYWSRPSKQEEYSQRQKIAEIAQKDERNIMLRDKSGRQAYIFNMLFHWLLFVVACICYAMGWYEQYSRFAMVALSILILMEYISGFVLFQKLSEKL